MSGMFNNIAISASGLTAERARLDVIAENLANANTSGYQRKAVSLQEVPFESVLAQAQSGLGASNAAMTAQGGGVQVASITPDGNPGRRVYDPDNPQADQQGYVTLPNVNPVTEMTDMITASRSYEANATALQTAKTMFQRTFDILR